MTHTFAPHITRIIIYSYFDLYKQQKKRPANKKQSGEKIFIEANKLLYSWASISWHFVLSFFLLSLPVYVLFTRTHKVYESDPHFCITLLVFLSAASFCSFFVKAMLKSLCNTYVELTRTQETESEKKVLLKMKPYFGPSYSGFVCTPTRAPSNYTNTRTHFIALFALSNKEVFCCWTIKMKF